MSYLIPVDDLLAITLNLIWQASICFKVTKSDIKSNFECIMHLKFLISQGLYYITSMFHIQRIFDLEVMFSHPVQFKNMYWRIWFHGSHIVLDAKSHGDIVWVTLSNGGGVKLGEGAIPMGYGTEDIVWGMSTEQITGVYFLGNIVLRGCYPRETTPEDIVLL